MIQYRFNFCLLSSISTIEITGIVLKFASLMFPNLQDGQHSSSNTRPDDRGR